MELVRQPEFLLPNIDLSLKDPLLHIFIIKILQNLHTLINPQDHRSSIYHLVLDQWIPVNEPVHIVLMQKLLQGIRRFPVSKLILLIGDKPGLSGEPKARKTTKQEVSKEDVYSAVLTIIDIIRTEQKAGRKVRINVSGSMRTIGVACYIVACMTNTKVYELLLFTLKDQSPERIEILQALGKGSAGSVEELIERLDPKLEKR